MYPIDVLQPLQFRNICALFRFLKESYAQARPASLLTLSGLTRSATLPAIPPVQG